jgi:hypothetical protein
MKLRYDKEKRNHIMTKAILASKQIKELSFKRTSTILRAADAVFPWFSEYFFMRNCPRDAGHWNREHKQPRYLS